MGHLSHWQQDNNQMGRRINEKEVLSRMVCGPRALMSRGNQNRRSWKAYSYRKMIQSSRNGKTPLRRNSMSSKGHYPCYDSFFGILFSVNGEIGLLSLWPECSPSSASLRDLLSAQNTWLYAVRTILVDLNHPNFEFPSFVSYCRFVMSANPPKAKIAVNVNMKDIQVTKNKRVTC